jgi:hypothetical protein
MLAAPKEGNLADEFQMSPETERQLERTVTRVVTVVFWTFAVCLSVFAITLTIVVVMLLWRLV